MRTNIELDDKLIEKAFQITSLKTKKDLVQQALKEFVESHQRKDLNELKSRGLILEDYDYKALRK